ncbi:MAG: PrpF domain-containing protein [Pseudaminobacter sp.]
MSEQHSISAVVMRGGSSKAVFLKEQELPASEESRAKLILALFGSPDKRQIDGLGGADYLTSKCAIMGPPTRPDADIDYTFAQISIVKPIVSFDVNCGNISAAAAVYAIEEGYVKADAPQAVVRVHNTNTGKVLRMKVPIVDGRPLIEGDFVIDGVPGSGAEIQMDFSDTAGACTGSLLPTGSPLDMISIPGIEEPISVSIVDVANMCVFIRASDLGLTGCELPGEVPAHTLAILEQIRVKSAAMSGVNSHILPLQVLVGAPQDYPAFVDGLQVRGEDVDLIARLFCESMMHKAYAGTGATCLAVAARIEGTTVHQLARTHNEARIRIGHPSGVLPVQVQVQSGNGNWQVKEVLFSRTARRLMEGTAFVREALLG